MGIRLVALDLDGTILTGEKRILPSTKRAIQEGAEKGVVFTFCTGRSFCEMQEFIMELPEVTYAICCNGASTIDLTTGQMVGSRLLPMGEVREIYQSLHGMDVMFEIFAEGNIYSPERQVERTEEYVPRELVDLVRATRIPVPSLVDFLWERTGAVEKLNLFFPLCYLGKQEGTREQALALLRECHLRSEFTYQEVNNLECNAPGVQKGLGLQKLSSLLGISREEILALGDNENDLSMFSFAGKAVAMGNATRRAKEAAGEITGTNEEDGVAAALQKYL